MIVLDASALVAILVEESEGPGLARRLELISVDVRPRFISAVSVWEAACAVARIWRTDRIGGFRVVEEFLRISRVKAVAADMVIAELALMAAERYGRGAGYPGILNLGDCFSYATAKHLGASLLFKGEDFAMTDITPA